MTPTLLGILIGLALHFLSRTAANTAAIRRRLNKENDQQCQ